MLAGTGAGGALRMWLWPRDEESGREDFCSIEEFMDPRRSSMGGVLGQEISDSPSGLIKVSAHVALSMQSQQDGRRYELHHTQQAVTVTAGEDVQAKLEGVRRGLLQWYERLQTEGSGSVLVCCLHMRLDVGVQRLLLAGGGRVRGAKGGRKGLPPTLAKKRALVDIKPRGGGGDVGPYCFKYGVLCALFTPKHHPDRLEQYFQYEGRCDWRGLDWPVPLHQVRAED